MTKNNRDHGIKIFSSLHRNAKLLSLIEEESLRFSKNIKLDFDRRPKVSIKGPRAQKPFGGVLLFSKEDLAFSKLRSLLSCFLKALHVCMFAFLNNRRILFLGDPRPLVQEHQQRLLYWFIQSQVETLPNKIRLVFTKDALKPNKVPANKKGPGLKKKNRLHKHGLASNSPGGETFGSLYSSLSAYQKVGKSKKNVSNNEATVSSMDRQGVVRSLPNEFSREISEGKAVLSSRTLVEKFLGRSATIQIGSKRKYSWDQWATLAVVDVSQKSALEQKNSSFFSPGSKEKFIDSQKKAFLRETETRKNLSLTRTNTKSMSKEEVSGQSEEQVIPVQKKESSDHLKKEQEHSLFYSSIAKLVSKASFRSTQWTASLAQPTNYWIGGFFSNNISRYRESLSTTTLTNIELHVPYSISNFFTPHYKPLYESTRATNYTPYSQLTAFSNKVSSPSFERVNKDKTCNLGKNTFSATLEPAQDYNGDLWDAIFAPVPRKEMSLSGDPKIFSDYSPKSRGFRGQIPIRIRHKRRSKRFHRKVLLYCAKGVLDIKTRSAWIKEADLVFFANPEKSLSLLNQINRFNIPTLGIIDSKSRLAIPFRTIKGPSYSVKSPNITYPIIGNPNSLHFLRLVLTRLSTLLNGKYKL